MCVCQCNPYNIAVHTCHTWTSFQGQTWCNKGHKHPHHHPQHHHHHCPPVYVQSIHMQVRVPTDHMEGTVPVFESKIAANARVHARTHATPYRIPSICSLRCPSATCVQTSAQCVPYRNHEHHCTPFAARSTSFDRPGFLNSTGRLGPKRGRKCYVTPAFSGVPNKGGQNQNSKPPLRVTMMPLGAPSISKYGSLVRPDAQIVALRLRRPHSTPCGSALLTLYRSLTGTCAK